MYHRFLRVSRYLDYLELNLSWTNKVHCKIDSHHIRVKVEFWIISPTYTKTSDQFADIFTKFKVYSHIQGQLGLLDLCHDPLNCGSFSFSFSFSFMKISHLVVNNYFLLLYICIIFYNLVKWIYRFVFVLFSLFFLLLPLISTETVSSQLTKGMISSLATVLDMGDTTEQEQAVSCLLILFSGRESLVSRWCFKKVWYHL